MIQSLYTGLSGLMVNQKGILVTSHNISNVNTEGYSKQDIKFKTSFPKEVGNIQIGTGVQVDTVNRLHNEYIFKDLKKNISLKNSKEHTYNNLKNIEDKLLDFNNDVNLSSLAEEVLNSIQDHHSNPNEISLNKVKETLYNFSSRVNYINNTLNNELNNFVEEKEVLLKKSKELLKNLEDINKEIIQTEVAGINANDLRDKLDQTELELSKIGNFNSYNKYYKDNSKYTYEFNEKGGKLQSLNDLDKTINIIKNRFNNISNNFVEEIEKYINNEQSYEKVLKKDYINDYSKKIDNVFLNFSQNNELLKKDLSFSVNILNQINERNDNLKKVNLDEEMINMIKYQRVYEANAKVIQTADSMLETILNMKR